MWVHTRLSIAPTGAGARTTLALESQGALGRLLGRMTRAITERYLGLEASGLKRRSDELARA